MNAIKVVCGIIYKDSRVLICRRKVEKSLGGYWEFPGGKVEDFETNEDSLKRELLEELGLDVAIDYHFMDNTHQYDTGTIQLISFKCSTGQSEIKLVDHDRIEWVPTSTLLNWKLAPADIPIAKALMKT
ncbi:(deoxy)nucleoside triphosphate pyrophosphohydrolase [Sphingobacterium sp. DN00404]|uniref:8-oxo-dGTP diphosphatase n=1 Tax=Sphingobacterium micropteri TaxID=2763501 RepID=A0ABR7YR13_9SPHI|nr:(deoxy)nucleoside triphosphate pyrophosphohydrolase [Sphingobacterium micropteri]MBD1433769.1 (deoxy)nucleoside triphosphate pyrophosphohydrolase [Sphingobacterium micropteri]